MLRFVMYVYKFLSAHLLIVKLKYLC